MQARFTQSELDHAYRVKRFFRNLEPTDVDVCWKWDGSINKYGYGFFVVKKGGKGKYIWSHRFSYELFIGEIPKGLVIDHLCRNRACANPYHLEPVSLVENLRRGWEFVLKHGLIKNRGTPRLEPGMKCRKGLHELVSDADIIQRKDRRCRKCSRARELRNEVRKKEKRLLLKV